MLPILATLSSVLLAPLGLEGWILQMCDSQKDPMKSIQSFGKKASLTKYALIIIIIALSFIAAPKISAADEGNDDNGASTYETVIAIAILLLIVVCVMALVNSFRSFKYC